MCLTRHRTTPSSPSHSTAPFSSGTTGATFYGYDAADVVGKAKVDLLHLPADVAAGTSRAILAQAARDGRWSGIVPRVRKNGTQFPARIEKSVRRDRSGNCVGFVSISKDASQELPERPQESPNRYIERLRIMHQIDRALIAGESSEAIAAAALPPLRELLGVRRAIVNLFDLEAGEAEWLAASGLRRVRVGPGVRYSLQFMGDVEALRRGETQTIDVHALPPVRRSTPCWPRKFIPTSSCP